MKLKDKLRKKILKWLDINDNKHSSNFSSDVLNENYMLDFRIYSTTNGSNNSNLSFPYNPTTSSIYISADEGDIGQVKNDEKKVVKIPVKPIEVLDQLESEPTPFSLLEIDQKIEMLNTKLKLISQSYAKRDIQIVLQRLQNRKLYPKYKKFFDQWATTNDEKINALLDKYDLVMKSAELFIPEFPEIAIQRMLEYEKYCMKICKKRPVFAVIATAESFAHKQKTRDPILLVQSPFGFYYDILGAWDTEMLYLPEL